MSVLKKETQKESSIITDIKKVSEDNASDLNKVVKILLDDSFFRRKTRANRRLLTALSIADTYAQLYDIEFFKEFIPIYTQYLTSQDGRARQEIVDITKYSIDKEKERYEMLANMGRR